ncbi:hypothetical protein BU26DRAFT_588411 [Trematosphaeria pertusa]|uniref:Uncharacterized protein n=1 Tax=Trematosphaeria pertusa TaxID=390896 RepID=A0A6A6IT30_9PLEO|nr:uncharacterized protein BU26DRAFT_588411 [Trematosphaeria pertusa]KAF2253459.1 hypothetical protein BU26DRAFT_588411 [Trematosphaeria pertusa]
MTQDSPNCLFQYLANSLLSDIEGEPPEKTHHIAGAYSEVTRRGDSKAEVFLKAKALGGIGRDLDFSTATDKAMIPALKEKCKNMTVPEGSGNGSDDGSNPGEVEHAIRDKNIQFLFQYFGQSQKDWEGQERQEEINKDGVEMMLREKATTNGHTEG